MTTHSEHINHGLPLDEDIKLAEMSWPVQRVGWALLLVFVICAALGLFGNGILSDVKEKRGDFQVEYQRFGRYEMPQQVTLRAPAIDGKVRLEVGQHFTEDFDIELITPQPKRELFADNNIVLEFEANAPVTLVFMLEPQRPGRILAPIKLNGQVFLISQFIYP